MPCYIGNLSQELFSSLVLSPRGRFVQHRATALLSLNERVQKDGDTGTNYLGPAPSAWLSASVSRSLATQSRYTSGHEEVP